MFKSLSSQFSQNNIYLNTATVGLGYDVSIKAMQADLLKWANGKINPTEYDEIINRCRTLFSGLVGAKTNEISVSNQASTSFGLLASTFPPGTKILAPEGDFTSVLFPFMAQQNRGIELTLVPLEQLIESVSPDFDWVACSIVQSSNGKVTALDSLSDSAKKAGCKLLLDGTQAVGWMPIKREHWDVLVCGAYKWLLSPRGTAFTAIKPELFEQIRPLNANWYAGDSPWEAIYGSPLRLASSARQYDISPAWLNWVGTLPALELINSLGVRTIHEHNTGLANKFCQRMELPPTDSAIVCIENLKNEENLRKAGIKTSVRNGALRVSFHLYNNENDVDSIVRAIS